LAPMAGPWRASEAAASPPPIRAARRVRPCPPRASLRQVCARTHPRQAGASIRSGGDPWTPASRGGAASRKPRGRPETALEGLRRGGVVSPARGLPAPFQRNGDACSARQGHSTGQAGSCAPPGRHPCLPLPRRPAHSRSTPRSRSGDLGRARAKRVGGNGRKGRTGDG